MAQGFVKLVNVGSDGWDGLAAGGLRHWFGLEGGLALGCAQVVLSGRGGWW